MKTIGIIGLGLIGGSFARAYKNSDQDFVVYAWNRTAETLNLAHRMGVVDGELTDERMAECDCILVCLHTVPSCKWLEDNAAKIPASCMVIDCCGTKRHICKIGFALAKKFGFTYVGGHPMAGIHRWGFKNSRADMYQGESFVVVPPVFDDDALIERVKSYVMPAGFGSISVTTAERHDKLIAFTSQLAHVVSNAYIKSPTALEHKGFSAGSYLDLTRVAWLNPTMWSDIFIENKDNLVYEIDRLVSELNKYRAAIEAEDKEKLEELLDEGRIRKEEVDG